MARTSRVVGVEELGTVQTIHDPWGMEFQPRDIKKARPSFKLILALFLFSYAVAFACISFINPIIEPYADKGDIFYTNINLQTHIALHNHHLEITQQQKKKNNPEIDPVSCSSLINDVGRNNASGGDGKGFLCCNRSHYRTDVCYLRGDVRTHSENASISLHTHNHKSTQEKIRPYTRKWEESTMNSIDEITIKTEDDENDDVCQVQHDVPAIVFSTGGYTGNVYHEFNDGLLPLYITSQHLHGQVVFMILEYHTWWMTKYGEIIAQLTNYPVIDFSKDKRVRCFPEMIIGLNIHDELSVNPALMKDGKSIGDFRALLSKAYAPRLSSMPRPQIINEEQSSPLKDSGLVSQLAKPKLVIISRGKSRKMMNQKAIVKLAEKIGFQVAILNPKRNTEMVDIFGVLNSSDVMVGVHGAAMTHFLFMRPGSVFIQIVPLGTDWASSTYYGQPATKLGLTYLEYKIFPEESSLFAEYERNDPVLRDPESVNRKGWGETKRVYLEGQNVNPSLKRFKKTLLSAYSSALARKQGNLPSINR